MSGAAKALLLGLLGTAGGMIAGGAVGLGGGLAWTSLTHTSGFEGYSGFVVAYWILAGVILGGCAGLFFGVRLGLRPNRPS